ncbi:LrgB family protein [Domibacillus epiphyticus]|uniref:LrgB family protein n=1 Tax=Domibacillus epiphyticus TaxID=1714355 RepID=A0A1V2ABJ4_9BACI|nr:LrgB family protein [Domibacillus epiphyticus]OMP68368.1 hypothetical protein BTO28_01740 [Domibacillus epiphyticus]
MGWIVITVFVYFLAVKINEKASSPFTLPVLTTTAFFVVLFSLTGTSHKEYVGSGAKWLSLFLNASIVALAIPLYNQRRLLKTHFFSILLGSCLGILLTVLIAVLAGKSIGLSNSIIASIIPQLTTMPIALALSGKIEGIPAITAAFVVIAGITGAIAGPIIMRILRVKSTIGRGVGMGCASHIIGVSQLLKNEKEAAAIGSVTMIATGITASFIIPYIIGYFL